MTKKKLFIIGSLILALNLFLIIPTPLIIEFIIWMNFFYLEYSEYIIKEGPLILRLI